MTLENAVDANNEAIIVFQSNMGGMESSGGYLKRLLGVAYTHEYIDTSASIP